MTLTAHGAGATAAAAFTLPALAFAVGNAVFERPPVRWEAVGAVGDFPTDTYVPKVITMTTGIGDVGKTTVYMRKRNEALDPKPNPPGYDEQFVAISTRCMHLGCPVRYVAASQRFICPCHGGVYDFVGNVVGGPRYSVNSELKRFDYYRDPAQPLDGIGQYLYPPRASTPKQ